VIGLAMLAGAFALGAFLLWIARGHEEMMRLDGRAPSQGWQDQPTP